MATLATDREVQAAKAIDGKPTDYAIKGEPGLRLRVMESGFKSWSLIYRGYGNKRGRTRLGEYPGLSLKEASKRAQKLRVEIDDGKDPAQEKRAAKLSSGIPETMDDLATLFLEKHAKPNTRQRTIEETERTLKRLLAKWKDKRLDSIQRRDVILYIDGIASDYPAQARRTLAVLSKLFNWAVEKDILQASPCFQVKAPSPKSRDRVLSDGELRLVWVAAGKLEPPFDAYIKMLTLTAQRRNEIAGLRWSEVDLTEKTWLLPANRAKPKRENLVPLAPAAMTILKALPMQDASDLVFTTTGTTAISGFANLKRHLDKLIAKENGGNPIPAWTLHDLRRTADTTMHRLGVLDTVVDRVLNHVIPGVRGVYNRWHYFPEKKSALEKWADFLDDL